jgi:hypothetical protein
VFRHHALPIFFADPAIKTMPKKVPSHGRAAVAVAADHFRREAEIEHACINELLEDAFMAAPALRATAGDIFFHRVDRRMRLCSADLLQGQNERFPVEWLTMSPTEFIWEPDKFEYVGRSQDGDSARQSGWLIFRHLEGQSGIMGTHGNSYWGCNGGMMDVIGAWPSRDYRVAADDGSFDADLICLPPEMCYGFRKDLHADIFQEGLPEHAYPTREQRQGTTVDSRGLVLLEEALCRSPSSIAAELRMAELALEKVCLVVPALFAKPGDDFEHRTDGRVSDPMFIVGFTFVGRTKKSWLIFQKSWTDHGCWTHDLPESPWHGGMRDVIGAWPKSKYEVRNKDGAIDKECIRLPPAKCYFFRRPPKCYSDEGEGDTDEGEGI